MNQNKTCLFLGLIIVAAVHSIACSHDSSHDGGAKLFIVAEQPGRESKNDSYVISLTNPDLISQARTLISSHDKLVSARIAPGKDGINRNYKLPAHPEWSWHVTEVLGFAKAAIELCDGGRAFVEHDVQGWIQNTGGLICFWNYTVVAELNE